MIGSYVALEAAAAAEGIHTESTRSQHEQGKKRAKNDTKVNKKTKINHKFTAQEIDAEEIIIKSSNNSVEEQLRTYCTMPQRRSSTRSSVVRSRSKLERKMPFVVERRHSSGLRV